MSEFTFALPPNFEDFEAEVETKGWFPGAEISSGGNSYKMTFYDAVRLEQTISDDIRSGGLFFEKNLVVIRSVTRANMEAAAKSLVTSGQLSSLAPE